MPPCLHPWDAADMWIHPSLTQIFSQENTARSDLHHMWHTYDGSKLISDAWFKWCGSNQGAVVTRWLQLLCAMLLLQRLRGKFWFHCRQSLYKLLVKLFNFCKWGLSKSNFLVLWKEIFELILWKCWTCSLPVGTAEMGESVGLYQFNEVTPADVNFMKFN